MSTPYYPHEHRAARELTEAHAITETAVTLRELAAYDRQSDASRAYLSFALAGLIEACGRSYRELPREVAHQARRVAEAADRATGSRP